QVRAGFYVCSLMIQLMENVYIDLNLDATHDHPANRSWMNLFMHWAWSGMFRVTWTILACTFSGEFQRFCERHLRLSLGEIEVNEILNAREMKFDRDGKGIFRPSLQTKEKLGAHLNPFEIMKIEKLLEDQRMKQAELPERCFSFNLIVKDPLCEKQFKKFTFGFALMNHSGGPAHIRYFRVQDHLRRIGLGRLALGKLIGLLTEELSTLHREKSKSELLDLITVAERPRKKGEKTEDDTIAESFSQLVTSVKTEKKEEYFKI
ncbi:MAG TPA: hypothetical protein VLL97_04960, partial [Acidobacteriota bacterium]|nr:hypothetical protein [Acidobacteriota bacterium]